MPPDDNCGGCRFYRGAKSLPDGTPVPAQYQAPGGICHRYPSLIRKQPADWCGEFFHLVAAEKDTGK